MCESRRNRYIRNAQALESRAAPGNITAIGAIIIGDCGHLPNLELIQELLKPQKGNSLVGSAPEVLFPEGTTLLSNSTAEIFVGPTAPLSRPFELNAEEVSKSDRR